jgi:hypothetical protein
MENRSNEPAARSPTRNKRMTISLADDASQMLEYLADSQNVTQNEALRRAIATEVYIKRELADGSKILTQRPDGEIREVVFR